MRISNRKLMTLVIEAPLARRLENDLLAAGAKGFTITAAQGQGPRNQRASDIDGGNVRIEAVLSEAVLELIIEKLKLDYFPHYAVACWISDVEVLRDERY